MSCTPKTLAPPGWVPTRAGRRAQLLPDCSLMSVTASVQLAPAPQGNGTASGPRAAYSHSRSDGRRLPDHPQYALASAQCTHETGRSGSSASYVHVALARAGTGQTPAAT